MKKIIAVVMAGSLLLLCAPAVSMASELSPQNVSQLSQILLTARVQLAAISNQIAMDQAAMAAITAQLAGVRARLSALQPGSPNAATVVAQAGVDVQNAGTAVNSIQTRQNMFASFLANLTAQMQALISLVVQLRAN